MDADTAKADADSNTIALPEHCSGELIITKVDNAKSKEGRVVILVRDTSSGPVLHFCQVPSKYSKGYSNYRADKKSFTEQTRNLFQIKQRRITPKVRKAELSFLHATCCLVLFYISTKYHQNILKGIQVTEQTTSFTLTGSVPKTISTPTTVQ